MVTTLGLVWVLAAQQSELEAAQELQLNDLRAEIASQIQLKAFDLIDELVFGWLESPLFSTPTPVVLAGVSVPVSLGTGLSALLENHVTSLLIAQPKTGVRLAHCPQCTALVIHSGARGTVISRGVDAPEALELAGGLSGAKHALFLDLEAEGASLVLRARVTAIDKDMSLTYARTLTSSTSTAALLRTGDHLKSASEARQEYLDAIAGRGSITIPFRVGIKSYASYEWSGVTTVPLIWLQAGIETGLTQASAWLASLSVGYTWAPADLNEGWLAQGRIARLLSGLSRSLTQPDLFAFVGASIVSIKGTNALVLRGDAVTADDLSTSVQAALGLGVIDLLPRATFAAFQLGLELRVKNRIGISAYLESMPGIDSDFLGSYVDLGFGRFEGLGGEVSFCF